MNQIKNMPSKTQKRPKSLPPRISALYTRVSNITSMKFPGCLNQKYKTQDDEDSFKNFASEKKEHNTKEENIDQFPETEIDIFESSFGSISDFVITNKKEINYEILEESFGCSSEDSSSVYSSEKFFDNEDSQGNGPGVNKTIKIINLKQPIHKNSKNILKKNTVLDPQQNTFPSYLDLYEELTNILIEKNIEYQENKLGAFLFKKIREIHGLYQDGLLTKKLTRDIFYGSGESEILCLKEFRCSFLLLCRLLEN